MSARRRAVIFCGQTMPTSAIRPRSRVVGGRPLLDEAGAGAVQRQDDLLVFFLDRDEAHLRPGDGFADRRHRIRHASFLPRLPDRR